MELRALYEMQNFHVSYHHVNSACFCFDVNTVSDPQGPVPSSTI